MDPTLSLLYMTKSSPPTELLLSALQVSGLPTNQAFLKRLASHPAFIAAELDTSFIQKHHSSLVDALPLPQQALALAAVADHLLQVQQASSCWLEDFTSSCNRQPLPPPLPPPLVDAPPLRHHVAAVADHLLQVQQTSFCWLEDRTLHLPCKYNLSLHPTPPPHPSTPPHPTPL